MENVTTERFKELQSQGTKLVVDFWAKWCGPCKTLIPRLEQIETEYPDIKFIKIDVDENMDTSLDMGIRSVPTVMIFNGEKLIDRTQGIQSDAHYKEVLNKL